MMDVFSMNAQQAEKELAIAQMNSCVNTLTNIINNKSMAVLEHESDQLLNNLTIQHMVGLPEIAEFRVDLIDAIGSLGITEEERAVLKRVFSIKQNNHKWQALSNALNNTMLLTGGGNKKAQIGFQALLTAARTGIEYKGSSNKHQIEELEAMWELRKTDLNDFVKLRKEALDIVFRLYQKYNLKESDRLTEQSSQLFQKIIAEPDAKRMVRLLNDNAYKFSHMADFYYYLGMGYLDCGNLSKANECFDKYDSLYQQTPIYRLNEKAGMISLARLTYNNGMSNEEIKKQISNVLSNLPNNAMASIQTAVITDNILKDPVKALSILRTSLDNEATDDKTAVLLASTFIVPKVGKNTTIYKDFMGAYGNQQYYDIDAAINMWIARKDNVFAKLKQIFKVSDLVTHAWVIGDAEVSNKITFSFPSKYTLDLSQVNMYVEKHGEKEVSIYPYSFREKNALTLRQIEKVACFKSQPNLKYLYMDALGNGNYMVKQDINYQAILQENYPRQTEFTLSEKDLKSIIKFLKENAPDKNRNEVIASKSDVKLKEIIKNNVTYYVPVGFNAKSQQLVNPAGMVGNTYVKFIFKDARKVEICYKLNKKTETLEPCYVQNEGKRIFINSAVMKEFGYKTAPKVKTSSASKNNGKVTSPTPAQKTSPAPTKPATKKEVKKAPASKPAIQKNDVKKKEDKSWWKIWESDEKKTEKKEQQKNIQKNETEKNNGSWWNRLTGHDDKKEQKSSDASNKGKSETKKKSLKDANKSKESPKKDSKEKKQEENSEKSWWKIW